MPRKKKLLTELGVEIVNDPASATTTNYQTVLAEYNKDSQLVSFIAPDGTPYFISGQAGVNSLIAGSNVVLTPPSGQGNVRIDVNEVGTVQSVALAMPNAFTVDNSPITNSGTLVVGYGDGQIPPRNVGLNATGAQDLFLNSAGRFTQVIGTAIPFLRFNGAAVGGQNQRFTNPILSVYNSDEKLITVLVNGVALSPPTVSPFSSGSYFLDHDTFTITDYLEPDVTVEVISKVIIANNRTVGTVHSVGLSVPQGLRVGNSPITDTGNLILNWDTGNTYLPQNSIGTGTTGTQTVLTGGNPNANWVPFNGNLADTQTTQTLNNKTLISPVISNLATPVFAGDAVNKNYVDAATIGFSVKEPVSYASTEADMPGVWTSTALTLTGPVNQPLTLDGYTFTAADIQSRVFVKDQGISAVSSAAVVQAGTAYQVGNILTVQGGTPIGGSATNIARFSVSAIGANGTLVSVALVNRGDYLVVPPDPATVVDTGLQTSFIVSIANGSTANNTSIYAIIVGGVSTFTGISLPAVPANSTGPQIAALLAQAVPTGWTASLSTVGEATQILFTSNISEPFITGTVTVTFSGDPLPIVNPPTPSFVSSINGQLPTGSGATLDLTFTDLTFQNGIYNLTALQTASTGVVLTRSSDMNDWTEVYRALVNVLRGVNNGGTTWIANVPQTGVIGTNDVIFDSFGYTGVVTGVPKGGTGRTDLPLGNLLIGNDTGPVITDSSLFWDNINNRLGIGTNTPVAALDVRDAIRLQQGYEAVNIISGNILGQQTIDLSTGAVFYYTSNATGNFQFNFIYTGSSINARLPIGHSLTATIITTQGLTAYYMNQPVLIDGSNIGVSTSWQGFLAPTFGNQNARDVYTFTIVKTANLTYTVFAVRTPYGG